MRMLLSLPTTSSIVKAIQLRRLIIGLDSPFDRPSGTEPLSIVTQALRTWLLSACPSGTILTGDRPSAGCTKLLVRSLGEFTRLEICEALRRANGFCPGGT